MLSGLASLMITSISVEGMPMVNVPQALASYVHACLERDGFAAVPELCAEVEIQELRDILALSMQPLLQQGAPKFARLIERCGPNGGSEVDLIEIFYPSSRAPHLLSTRVFHRCARLARALRPNYELYFDSFITKAPYSQHSVFWHRDANFSPMKRLRAAFMPRVHFWLPVQDVSPANGGLQFIAGSHKEPHILHLREERIVASSLGAGGLTIHLPETLHYSAPNNTGAPRSAWLMTFGRFGALKLGLRKFLKQVPVSSGPP